MDLMLATHREILGSVIGEIIIGIATALRDGELADDEPIGVAVTHDFSTDVGVTTQRKLRTICPGIPEEAISGDVIILVVCDNVGISWLSVPRTVVALEGLEVPACSN
jgi:hypothetical protein